MTQNDISPKNIYIQLRKENKKLKDLLLFAYRKLSYLNSVPEEDSEYDFCLVCLKPEWDHKESCEAVIWEKEVKEILGK